ncbi:unnamed protein product, partial [Sphagnum jensenii]
TSSLPLPEWKGIVTEIEIDCEDGYKLPLRIYSPNSTQNSSPLPVIIWYHGGGFVIGSAVGDHAKCVLLSFISGYIVVSVEYRLAPEYMYPIPLNDSFHAFKWIHKEVHRYGGDASKTILAGESAGGNLAASVTSINNDHIDLAGLLLFYP